MVMDRTLHSGVVSVNEVDTTDPLFFSCMEKSRRIGYLQGMAAITPFLDRTVRTEETGTEPDQCPIGEPPGGPLPTLGDLFNPTEGEGDDLVHGIGPPKLGEVRAPLGDFGVIKDMPPLEKSHAELTRTVWIRRAIEEQLMVGGRGGGPRDYWVEADCKTGEFFFHLSPAMEKDILPWYVGVKDTPRFSFFGSNGKMGAPTFDLPAGAPSIGGSCPGATAAQSVVEPGVRKGQLIEREGKFYLPVLAPGEQAPMEVRDSHTICASCYALEGNYPSPHVQIGEILRYWWTRSLLADGKGEEWVETMVRAVAALNIPLTRQGIRPIRVHSSGDFFSPNYAAAWMEVANRVWDLEVAHGRASPEIRFWAPTRTWAAKGFDWAKISARLAQPNMIVRPSAYHVDDDAPGPLVDGWPAGTTSVINSHNHGMASELTRALTGNFAKVEAARDRANGHDTRFEWTCQTYAIDMRGGSDLSHSCEDAVAPDGKKGCRMCWTHPQLRVNYTTH